MANSASGAVDSFDVIEVGAGERFTKRLSNGETWENKIIDITASGASYLIYPNGVDNWTIRNIGVRGTFDTDSNGSQIMIKLDEGQEGLIENVYLPGRGQIGHSSNGSKAIYCHSDHAGHVEVRNMYAAHHTDAGVYATSPGHTDRSHPSYPGGQGSIYFKNCYFLENATGNVRIATEGSGLEDCVIRGNPRVANNDGLRAVWGPGPIPVINCHISNCSPDIRAGGGAWNNEDVEVHATNSSWESESERSSPNGTIVGSSQGTPEHFIPDGVPTSAEEAASGDPGGSDPHIPEGDFELVFTTSSDLAEYLVELYADSVEPGDDADTHDHEFQDRAFEHDGRWYVHGYTAGGGDNYHVENGEILRVGQLQGNVTIHANHRRTGLDNFDTIEEVPDDEEEEQDDDEGDEEDDEQLPEGDFELRFTTMSSLAEYLVELDAAAVEPGDDANTHDHEYQDRAFEHDGRWYIHGYTAGGGDNFHVEDGEILRVGQLQGETRIDVDSEEIDVDEFDEIQSVPGDEDDKIPTGNFELEFTTESNLAEYLVELDAAAVEPGDDANTHDHEYQDRAFEQDGRWYIHGYTAGGGDNYHVEDGEILRVGQLQGVTTIAVEEKELDLDRFDEIESTPVVDHSGELEVAGQFSYRIEVDGTIEPAEDHRRWLTEGESFGDDWAEWWLSGSENARTVWNIDGRITSLEIRDHDGETEIRTLELNGEEISPADF